MPHRDIRSPEGAIDAVEVQQRGWRFIAGHVTVLVEEPLPHTGVAEALALERQKRQFVQWVEHAKVPRELEAVNDRALARTQMCSGRRSPCPSTMRPAHPPLEEWRLRSSS